MTTVERIAWIGGVVYRSLCTQAYACLAHDSASLLALRTRSVLIS